MVLWITGLSGAGKTTIGREVYRLWKEQTPATVLVDGDEVRRMFRHDTGPDAYTLEGRRKNAERICELCAWLDRQQINVVCCILSLFEASRAWNRANLSHYFEVFLDVPLEKLVERDVKNLYRPALAGEMPNVAGVDLPFEPPEHPDLVIDNRRDGLDPAEAARHILREAGILHR